MTPASNLLKTMDYSVVQQCMHCGMCLPTCPTYMETKRERNSPRGRISLMRSIADGDLAVTREFADEMYYCLGCLACETACPAGVQYADLFETARAEIERQGAASGTERTFWRWLTLKMLFIHPAMLRFVGRALWLYQGTWLERFLRRKAFFHLVPAHLLKLEPQTPVIADQFSDELIEPVERPVVTTYRVGLLTGCVQDLVFSNVNRDTADVLLANHCEVITPREQHCCGSLHGHNGAIDLARDLARKQIDSFDLDTIDAIITNAGGCGSHLKKYGHLLHDDPDYAARAAQWDSKVKDIHEWLVQIKFRKPTAGCGLESTTYHKSCHLCHGQKVVSQPRQVLNAIPGLKLIDLPESNWCCGSAGIYNITQPEQSAKLLERKLVNLEKTKAPAVATSNPGCHLQLQNGLRAKGSPSCQTVTQPVTLLARAYRNEAVQ